MAGPLESRPLPLRPPQVSLVARDGARWQNGDVIFVPDAGLQVYQDGLWYGLVHVGAGQSQALAAAAVDHDDLPGRGTLPHAGIEAALIDLDARLATVEDLRYARPLMLMGA